MKHIRPTYCEQFYCTGESCPAPCPAPLDMTWTRAVGEFCETGLSLACSKAATLILQHAEKTTFHQEHDTLPPDKLSETEQEYLARILDARKTMDLLLQDRDMGYRPSIVLALTYGAEFDPLITAKNRYAYEELDWGFTEQPNRQFQAVVQLIGSWEHKRTDMCSILSEFQQLCIGDTILDNHLSETLKLFQTISGEEYRIMRDQFDRYMEQKPHLFENLLLYYVHRYFLSDTNLQTVEPGVKLMAVSAALLRALAARIWKETGNLTEDTFTVLCWHYARCTEENQKVYQTICGRFCQSPLYSWERLQRLLWR